MHLLKRHKLAFWASTISVLIFLSAGCTEGTRDLQERRVPLEIGDSVVEVILHESKDDGLTYLNLHDDENTAVEAALSVAGEHGGRVIELQHTGERNITFALEGDTFAFDPNRMFTDAGIDSSLSRFGQRTDPARAAVASFADSVLALSGFDELSTIVTVHNNTDGGYSARQYIEGAPYARDARFVHITTTDDADDFFFVTTEDLYNDLRAADFNVVMQDNALVTDDGSLSVLAGYRGIPYVNAEAQHGHFEAQRRMLMFLDDLLAADDGR